MSDRGGDTNASGQLSLTAMQPGTYRVRFSGERVVTFEKEVVLRAGQIADLDIGILYVLAMSSLAVYGVVLGGWASNSRWALLGGIRGSAQMISYEIAMGLALIGAVSGVSVTPGPMAFTRISRRPSSSAATFDDGLFDFEQ